MSVVADGWLAEALGRPVFSVSAAVSAAEVKAHASSHRGGLYWTKVPCADVARVRALVEVGFYTVDTAITLRRPPRPVPAAPRAEVRDCTPEMAAAVAEVAGRAFRLDRFHLDPALADADADRVKREWAANNACGARGIHCLVALREQRVAGFLSVLERRVGHDLHRVIDLVAVAPEHQGNGIAGDLVAEFVRRHGPGADALAVGTQAANLPSLAVYTRTGFRPVDARYVMHLHA